MEQLFAVEIWLALIGVACITGWLIGDWHGSERMRRMICLDESLGYYDWEPLRKAEKRGAVAREGQRTTLEPTRNKKTAASITPSSEPDFQRGATGFFATTASPANIEQQQKPERKSSSGIPSLADLHEHANAIRRSGRVWDSLETGIDYEQIDPKSAKILMQYKTSIEALQSLDHRDATDQFERQLPRFSDAAPVSPFFNSGDCSTRTQQTRGAGPHSQKNGVFFRID